MMDYKNWELSRLKSNILKMTNLIDVQNKFKEQKKRINRCSLPEKTYKNYFRLLVTNRPWNPFPANSSGTWNSFSLQIEIPFRINSIAQFQIPNRSCLLRSLAIWI